MNFRKFATLAAIVFASGASSLCADDGIFSRFGLDLGYAGRTQEWAIFAYGAGTANSRFNAIAMNGGASSYQVTGNVALAGAYSTMTMNGNLAIDGDLYRQTTSTLVMSGRPSITGSQFQSSQIDSQFTSGITALQTVSTGASHLSSTSGSPATINIRNQDLMFNNAAFGGTYVMNLTDFVLGGNSTLTLNGAAGSAFVFNISGSFDMSGNASIVLAGGLTTSDVLFNVTGSNPTLSISGNSVFEGTLLAYNASGPQRTLRISGHSLAEGELIADSVVLSGDAKVRHPKKKSKD